MTDDKYNKSFYELLNDDLLNSNLDPQIFKPKEKTDMQKLRDRQNKGDKIKQRLVKPYIQRVAKSLDNPLNTNPNMLWEVKRQNHKLLKTERNPKLREKMVQEIIDADQQIIKNIDEETDWMTSEKKKISKQITEEEKKK